MKNQPVTSVRRPVAAAVALAGALLTLGCGDFFTGIMGTEYLVVAGPYRWHHPRSLSDTFDPAWPAPANSSFTSASAGGSDCAIVAWRQERGGENHVMMRHRRFGVWSAARDLSLLANPAGGVSSSQQTAMNRTGDAIIVWLQGDGLHTHVYGRHFRGGTWHAIDSGNGHIDPEGQSSNSPHAAIDESGNALVVWSQNDGAYSHIYKSEYRNGAWTHPSSLAGDNLDPEVPSAQPAYRPRAAMDGAGSAIIVWCGNSDASNTNIYRSEYRSGAWAHPATLADHVDQDTVFSQTADSARVAMGDNGEAAVVWTASDGTETHVYMTEYRSGAWSGAPDVVTGHIDPDGQDSESPGIAMDATGATLITWVQGDGTVRHVYRSEYRGGSWTHPSGLTDNIDPDGSPGDALEPRVAMDGGGSAIITWYQADLLGFYHIYMAEYRGGAWRYPASLQADNIDPRGGAGSLSAMWPAVAMSDSGIAVIAWHGSDGLSNRIYTSEYARRLIPVPR